MDILGEYDGQEEERGATSSLARDFADTGYFGSRESSSGCSIQVLVHCGFSLPHMSHLHLGVLPSLEGSVHAYVEVFVVHSINNREVLKQAHSPEDFGCSVVKSRNPKWEYMVEQTLSVSQITGIRLRVWDHHIIRKRRLVGEVDIDHADLPSADGKQQYMLELKTSKKLPEDESCAINVTVTVNGVLPRADSIQL